MNKPSNPSHRDMPAAGRTERARHGALEPRLPHERDESADTQAPTPPANVAGKRAWRDAARAMPDTDRGPVLERTYREHVATTPPRKRR